MVSDTLVGPIVTGLIAVAQQIPEIDPNLLYPSVPDGTPEFGSVFFLCKDFSIVDPTNGRLTFKFIFNILHLFDRGNLAESLADIQAFLPSWASVLSAWGNQELGGAADSMTLESGSIRELTQGGQAYLALALEVSVLKDFLIPTS